MCGFAGLWNRQGAPADPAALEAMLRPIRYRGPDDEGRHQAGPVAFGHLRLAILDPSERAHQPMHAPDGSATLLFNGEVYNFGALRRELEAQGAVFAGPGDTEVVFAALRRWGPERAVARFNGMFAIAFWEAGEQVLWLARDRLGIKPLYLARTQDCVCFASEIKALLAHPGISAAPDVQALITILVRGRLEGARTPFLGIKAVEPGCLLRITASGLSRTRYWHALKAIDPGAIADRRAVEVDRALAESVRLHLASDVKLAAMCSGGLDSSLVAAHARALDPDLGGYVADVEGPLGEGDRARRVGRHLDLPIRVVRFDRAAHLRLWPRATWHSEHPNVFASDTALLQVADTCRREGVKVLLTGEGADELFGGYRWQARTFRLWRRRRLRPEAPLFDMLAGGDRPLRRRLAMVLDNPRAWRAGRIFEKLAPVRPAADRAFLAHCVEDLYGHLGAVLRRHDRMGMAASIEMRVPFLENGLIDLALHLPRRAKFRRGRGKWVLKQVGKRHLPRDVVCAPKQGFSMPADYYRGPLGLLRGGVVADLLHWGRKRTGALLEEVAKEDQLRFQLVSMELWGRLFLLRERPESLAEALSGL